MAAKSPRAPAAVTSDPAVIEAYLGQRYARRRPAPAPPRPEIRRRRHDAPEPAGRRRGTGAAPLLQVRQLNVAYGDVQVLWDVDLDIYQGEIVALVGANGAGKSTLLATLSGLLRPASGEIRLRGAAVADADPRTQWSPRDWRMCRKGAGSSRR